MNIADEAIEELQQLCDSSENNYVNRLAAELDTTADEVEHQLASTSSMLYRMCYAYCHALSTAIGNNPVYIEGVQSHWYLLNLQNTFGSEEVTNTIQRIFEEEILL